MSASNTDQNARVHVEILGERYTIKGEADPGYISEVARLVDERMRELSQSSNRATGNNRARLAVLTAINLADELLQARMDSSAKMPMSAVMEFEERTHQLISLLDEGLIGDSELLHAS
ncbi:MAG: cell division protein ZapA [Leptospiraceae bacterium]|nr:cell division protein ZapA [Leptospiraceae bacterium]